MLTVFHFDNVQYNKMAFTDAQVTNYERNVPGISQSRHIQYYQSSPPLCEGWAPQAYTRCKSGSSQCRCSCWVHPGQSVRVPVEALLRCTQYHPPWGGAPRCSAACRSPYWWNRWRGCPRRPHAWSTDSWRTDCRGCWKTENVLYVLTLETTHRFADLNMILSTWM